MAPRRFSRRRAIKRLDVLLQNRRIAAASRFIPRGSRVLDVGCADGALFRHLGERCSGVGVDPRRDDVETFGRYVLLPGRLADTELPARPYDVLTLLAVMEHLPPQELSRLGAEAAARVRPGGRVIATVPSPAVDPILRALSAARVIDGIALDEHHGFDPATVVDLFPPPDFSLVVRKRFEAGLNNLFVFERSATWN